MEKEIVFEDLEERYDNLLNDFINYLTNEVKLSKKVVKSYRHGANLVCLSGLYGCPVEPNELCFTDFSEAIEYFGIHKYYISSLSDAKNVIASFKHFAKFLCLKEIINEEAYNDIIDEIKTMKDEWLEAVSIRLNEDRDIYYEMIMPE